MDSPLDSLFGSSSEGQSPLDSLFNDVKNTVSSDVKMVMSPLDSLFNQQQQQTSSDPWQQFQQKAQNIVTQRGLPQALMPVLTAQAAIESARGQSAPGNNYFGIKGGGNAGSNNLATEEYGNGGYYGENSNFASYQSPDDSINAYIDLILRYPGVKEALQSNNPEQIINAIERNGYATSPTYVQNVMNTPEFRKYVTM